MSVRTARRLDRVVLAFFSSALALLAFYFGFLVLRFAGPPGWVITGTGVASAFVIAFGLARLHVFGAPHVDALRGAVVAVAIAALAAPLLVNLWIRGDYDRYVWIIHQGGSCSYMGSGPGVLMLFGASWVLGVALFGLVVATRQTEGRSATVGVATGSLLITLMALVLFVDQTLFARLLGCL